MPSVGMPPYRGQVTAPKSLQADIRQMQTTGGEEGARGNTQSLSVGLQSDHIHIAKLGFMPEPTGGRVQWLPAIQQQPPADDSETANQQ